MEPTGRINSKPTRRRGLLRPASIEQLHSSGVQQRKAKFFAPDDPWSSKTHWKMAFEENYLFLREYCEDVRLGAEIPQCKVAGCQARGTCRCSQHTQSADRLRAIHFLAPRDDAQSGSEPTPGPRNKDDEESKKTCDQNENGNVSGKLKKVCGLNSAGAPMAKSYITMITMTVAERLQGLLDVHASLRRWWCQPELLFSEETPTKVCSSPSGSTKARCHQHADSLFSSTSGFKNYRGLLNLCIVLLVLATGRVAIENVLKYGILVDPVIWLHVFVQNPYAWPSFLLVLLVNAFILVSYTLEILLSKRQLGEGLGKLLQVLNLVVLIVFPMVVVLQLHPSASSSSVALVLYTVTFLKLISYLQVNKWCRDEQLSVMTNRRRYKSLSYAETEEVMDNSVKNSDEDSDEDGITFETKVRKKNSANGCVTSLGNTKAKQVYPDNVNLKDLYYFMVAPTLCYELDFPRSGRIRKRFLLKRIGEMVFLSGLIMSLCQQWIIPIVHNSYQPFNEMKFFEMLERLLKLSVPNHLIWLIFFYWYFHSCLNVLAEVLMFGDRIFYRDWWNAPTIECFWAKWNVPVHRWCVRHVYKPMLNMGFSKLQGSIFVFAISAFFHEYLVSVPLGMFRYWAFIAMLTQVPLAAFVRRFLDEKNGNIVMWLSVILGQPAAILMYYHDYYILHLLGNSTVDVHS